MEHICIQRSIWMGTMATVGPAAGQHWQPCAIYAVCIYVCAHTVTRDAQFVGLLSCTSLLELAAG